MSDAALPTRSSLRVSSRALALSPAPNPNPISNSIANALVQTSNPNPNKTKTTTKTKTSPTPSKKQATSKLQFSKRKNANIFDACDLGNEADVDDEAHTCAAFSESEHELEEQPENTRVRTCARMPSTASAISTTPVKEKSKRKRFPEEEPTTGGARKRALRSARTPVMDHIMSGINSTTRENTPVASKLNEGVATRSSSIASAASSSSSETVLVKPIALRPSTSSLSSCSSSATATVLAKPDASLHLASCSQLLTPRAITEGAFVKYGSTAKKSVCKDVEMDDFFNSPTQKSLGFGSIKKNARASSPTPKGKSQLGLLTSDSEQDEGDNSSSSNSVYGSCLNSSSFSDSGAPRAHPWLKRFQTSTTNTRRRLFVSEDTFKVDLLSDRMTASALETPKKAIVTQQSSFISRHSKARTEDEKKESRLLDSAATFPLLGTPGLTDGEEYDSDCSVKSSQRTVSPTTAKTENALTLVFQYMITRNLEILPAMCTCKLWGHTAQQELWKAPFFFSLSAMYKMHKVIYGSGPPTGQQAQPAPTSKATKKKTGGIRGMLGTYIDPSSPRKLLFPDQTIPTPPHNNSTNNSSITKPNPKLARLVKSISFHLVYPGDTRFPPAFDVQSFLTDTFPNLRSISLSGITQWINPFLFRQIATNDVAPPVEALEFSSGSMDRMIGQDGQHAVLVGGKPLWMHLTGVKRFVVSESRVLSDCILRMVGEASSCGLQEVRLVQCGNVTQEGVMRVFGKRVKVLEVSFCEKVGDGLLRSLVYGAAQAQRPNEEEEGFGLEELRLAGGLFSEEGIVAGLTAKLGGTGKPLFRLKRLGLTAIKGLTAAGVRRIVESQPRLESFKIKGCSVCLEDAKEFRNVFIG
ncbi:UNVERIFIED_CONTAM: hypothetical protein HDU68_001330 [Siphonaria sp. JEL0065]|nr:hypothetical protein HDU68_001330 [Siphonaria sp. JEL0065]